jgi:hypothetical protein
MKHVKSLVTCQLDTVIPLPSSDHLMSASSLNQVPPSEALNQVPPSEARPSVAQIKNQSSSIRLPSKPTARASRATSLPEQKKRSESPSPEDIERMRLVRVRVQECEAKVSKRRFFSKKSHLALDNLGLTENQVPVQALGEGQLGLQLQSLSLANNKLSVVPPSLVVCLPQLRALDLSNCLLFDLPTRWNLPLLKTLNLSYNMLRCFPGEVRLSFMLLSPRSIAFLSLGLMVAAYRSPVLFTNSLISIPLFTLAHIFPLGRNC